MYYIFELFMYVSYLLVSEIAAWIVMVFKIKHEDYIRIIRIQICEVSGCSTSYIELWYAYLYVH